MEEASLVPEEWLTHPSPEKSLIARKAKLLDRDGMVHVIYGGPAGKYYLHRGPMGVFRLTVQAGPLPPLAPLAKGNYDWGAAMWDEWHKAARRLETPAERVIYLARYTARLPCGGCKSHFTQMQVDFPPDFRTAEGFFRYSFDSHNRVNAKLGKPEFTFEEAERLYPPEE